MLSGVVLLRCCYRTNAISSSPRSFASPSSTPQDHIRLMFTLAVNHIGHGKYNAGAKAKDPRKRIEKKNPPSQ